MECTNHPGVQALDRCAGCAELFCQNCLVNVQGRNYCASCKVMALDGQTPTAHVGPTQNCKDAGTALTYGIIGLFCFGIILGPMAIAKASSAKKQIAADPSLTGSGMATAGMVLGVIATVLWVLGCVTRIAMQAQTM